MTWSETFKNTVLASLTEEQKNDRVVQRLLFIVDRGKIVTQEYLRSESDKWMHLPHLIPLFETHVFDAGESGIETRTPWNAERVFRAKSAKFFSSVK